jgi:hypothetical protein
MDEVFVEYGDSAGDTATLLLAAAEELELDVGVVRSVEGGFMAPQEVAEQAGFEITEEDESGDDDG